jgi:hypothetical protein
MTSLYSLLHGRGPFDKRAALELLRKEQIGKLEIEFSGGNDEGGVDSYAAFAPDGSELKFAFERTWPDVFVDGRYQQRELTEEERRVNQLLDTLEQPIDDRYGSFAGDFHVNGRLTYDVAEGTVAFAGDESTDEPFALEL